MDKIKKHTHGERENLPCKCDITTSINSFSLKLHLPRKDSVMVRKNANKSQYQYHKIKFTSITQSVIANEIQI